MVKAVLQYTSHRKSRLEEMDFHVEKRRSNRQTTAIISALLLGFLLILVILCVVVIGALQIKELQTRIESLDKVSWLKERNIR